MMAPRGRLNGPGRRSNEWTDIRARKESADVYKNAGLRPRSLRSIGPDRESAPFDEVKAKRRAPAHLLVWFLFLIVLIPQSSSQPAVTLVLIECILVAFGGVFSLSQILRAGLWSPASLFYIVLALFHLGLIPAWLFGIDPGFTRATDYVWFDGPIGMQSLVITLVAMASYVAGVSAYATLRTIKRDVLAQEGPDAGRQGARRSEYGLAGAVLTTGGVLAWFVIGIAAGGVQIFTASYSTWLN
ncbi:MAG TPA: hypothetical protein VN039_16520, partial [Nitrospira sp.]|nr:hypothetical protein [Nitrospira sp.]